MSGNRLVTTFTLLLGVLRIGNLLFAVAAVVVFAATFAMAGSLMSVLLAKYGASGAATALGFVRALLFCALPAAYAAERVLRALRDMLGTVRAGDPFVVANAARLRVIGWALLALQLLDLLFGAGLFWARAAGMEVIDWQPAVTGWLAVLTAFVLARVFAAGAAMRDDLAATI